MSTVTMISWLISSINTNEAVPLNLCLPSISPLLHHRVSIPSPKLTAVFALEFRNRIFGEGTLLLK